MELVHIDLETAYQVGTYSLTNLGTHRYILDPRFQLIGMGIQWPDDRRPTWHTRRSLEQQLQRLRDHQCELIQVSFNCTFDASVLDWRFDFRAAELACPMAMARSLGLDKVSGLSLDALGQLAIEAGADLPRKGHEVVMASGKWLDDFSPGELADYGRYCVDDTRISRGLFDLFAELLQPEELMWQSTVMQMFVHRPLRLNRGIVERELERVNARRAADLAMLCQKLGVDNEPLLLKVVGSGAKLAEAITLFGGKVPMKVSPANGKQTFAFAKTDGEFLAMLEHSVPEVAALVAARLGLKSSIEQTRCAKFLELEALGPLPVPVKVSGAHTHRLSGEGDWNCMSAGHELLTPRGWVRIDQWQPDQPVMQWWPDGTLCWEMNPSKVSVWTDRVVEFDAPFVKAQFTPDHRMVRYPSATVRGRVIEKLAGHVAASSGIDYVPTAGRFNGDSPRTPDEVRLLVAVAADGSITPHGAIDIGLRKVRKIKRLRALLAAAGVQATEAPHGADGVRFYIAAGSVPKWLVKGYGPWVLQLSSVALEAACQEFVQWDGHPNSNSGQTTVFTTRHDQAQWIATVMHLTGRAGSIYRYASDATSTGEVFHIYERQRDTTSIDSARHATVHARRELMYCPQVESSYVLTRFGGRIHVTGQCQNLPSGRKPGQSKALKESIEVPPGYVVTGGDSSQVEVRVMDYASGDIEALEEFRRGVCPYSSLALRLWPAPGIEPGDVKRLAKAGDEYWGAKRQLGKTIRLGAQFGIGPRAFRDYAETQAGIAISWQEAKQYVKGFRTSKPAAPKFWRTCDNVLKLLADGEGVEFGGPSGKLLIADPHRKVLGRKLPGIRLPDGMWLSYPDLEFVEVEEWVDVIDDDTGDVIDRRKEWRNKARFWTRKGRSSIPVYTHGATITENIVQALAFAAMKHQASLLEFPLVFQEHDAHYVISSIEEAARADTNLGWAMMQPPPWAPDLPLACEKGQAGSIGKIVKR